MNRVRHYADERCERTDVSRGEAGLQQFRFCLVGPAAFHQPHRQAVKQDAKSITDKHGTAASAKQARSLLCPLLHVEGPVRNVVDDRKPAAVSVPAFPAARQLDVADVEPDARAGIIKRVPD